MFSEFSEYSDPESKDYDITSSLGGNIEPVNNGVEDPNDFPDEIPEDVEAYEDFSSTNELNEYPDEIPEDIEEFTRSGR